MFASGVLWVWFAVLRGFRVARLGLGWRWELIGRRLRS
jgi:hypothetical protein